MKTFSRKPTRGSGRSAMKTQMTKTEVRDGMTIDFDVPIPMDDGINVCADVFLPIADGVYPVVMTMGPYAKGLHFEDGYGDAWHMMCDGHPDVPAPQATSTPVGRLPIRRSGCARAMPWCEWTRVARPLAGKARGVLTAGSPGLLRLHQVGRRQSWSSGKVGLCGISYSP